MTQMVAESQNHTGDLGRSVVQPPAEKRISCWVRAHGCSTRGNSPMARQGSAVCLKHSSSAPSSNYTLGLSSTDGCLCSPAEGIFQGPTFAVYSWYLWLKSYLHEHKGQRHYQRWGSPDNLIRENRVLGPSSSQSCHRRASAPGVEHNICQDQSMKTLPGCLKDWGGTVYRDMGFIMGCRVRISWDCVRPRWGSLAGKQKACVSLHICFPLMDVYPDQS